MAIIGCKDRRTKAFLAGERVKEFQAFADAAAKALTRLQAAVVCNYLEWYCVMIKYFVPLAILKRILVLY